MGIRAFAAVLLVGTLVATPWAKALAQVETSTQVSDVSVTIYRDPNRGQGAVNASWPGGYALISETRTITIPQGDGIIRFEGVAEGMLPESALVSGLPSGVREKNRDARLLSPSGLVDAFLKRRVQLVRTSLVNGKRTEQEAVISAGPEGGVLVETEQGTEALGCSGLPERMRYESLPEGLSAKPTLSIMTRSKKAQRVTVKLTYLAQGFDWSAHYVANTDVDKGKMHLFAWATLVNGGAQSFANARVQLIAGQANYRAKPDLGKEAAQPLVLRCWPLDNTATHPVTIFEQLPFYAAPTEEIQLLGYEKLSRTSRGAVAVAPPPIMMALSAPAPPQPAMIATQENFGDLKLYRIPERVTVAAQSSKQVAMINQSDVSFSRVYFLDPPTWQTANTAAQLRLETENVKAKGLGLPLPSGAISTSETLDGAPLFTGEAALRDYAVGDEIWYAVGSAAMVRGKVTVQRNDSSETSFRAEISNAYSDPVPIELALPSKPIDKADGLAMRNGRWTIRAIAPANESLIIEYRIR